MYNKDKFAYQKLLIKADYPFGAKRGSIRHTGIDILGGKGTPVKSILSGRLLSIEKRHKYYGKVIKVAHNLKYLGVEEVVITSLYAHCDEIIADSNYIESGAVIARMGNTGNVWTYDSSIDRYREITEEERNDKTCQRGVHTHMSLFYKVYNEENINRITNKLINIFSLEKNDHFVCYNKIWINPVKVMDYLDSITS